MLNNADVRAGIAKFVDPVARTLLKIGVSPDAVTYIGTLGISASALWFFPRGQFVIGVLVMLLFVFSDLLDGTMARMSGRAGDWGNFLDSTLDRLADGAVFGGLLIYFATRGESIATAAAWVCLVGGFTISYAKARAESVGASANVGIAERAERLIAVVLAVFVQGIVNFIVPDEQRPWVLIVVLVILAILIIVTIGQRFAKIRSQLGPYVTSKRAQARAAKAARIAEATRVEEAQFAADSEAERAGDRDASSDRERGTSGSVTAEGGVDALDDPDETSGPDKGGRTPE